MEQSAIFVDTSSIAVSACNKTLHGVWKTIASWAFEIYYSVG